MAKKADAETGRAPIEWADEETDSNVEPEAESGSAALQAGAGLLLALLVNIAAMFWSSDKYDDLW